MFPVINVTQVNETTVLFVLQPAGNLGAVPRGSLTTDSCGTKTDGTTCDYTQNSLGGLNLENDNARDRFERKLINLLMNNGNIIVGG